MYAKSTTVPVEKTKAEIETTLRRFGAEAFNNGWDATSAFIMFKAKDRFVRFVLPLPSKDEKRFQEKQHKGRYYATQLTDTQSLEAWEQEVRSRWRALLLSIKAKLESVEAGIENFEQAFLAHVVLPDQTLVGDRIREALSVAYETGKMPVLMPHTEDNL